MTNLQYKGLRIGISAFVAGSISYAVTTNNWTYAVPVIIVGVLLALALKKMVKEITHDERDLANAGLAARYAILAYSLTAAAASLPLFALRDVHPQFEPVASALAYSACALMLLHGFFFELVSRHLDLRHSRRALIIGLIFAAIMVPATLRLFSGEDSWDCQDGRWVAHGHPDAAMPSAPCPAK